MLKQFVITIALVSFLGVYTLAQEQPNTDKKEKYNKRESSENSVYFTRSKTEINNQQSPT